MRETDRFEYKYALDLRTYYAFKHALTPYVSVDAYTKKAPKKRYFVRSLYYDTDNFRHYSESDEGQFGRVKCRVRTYAQSVDKAEEISIEIKTKHGVNVKKYSELIPQNVYTEYLKTQRFPFHTPVLDEFERMRHVLALRPKLIVEYEREGYVTKDATDIRITFDHDVRSARQHALFNTQAVHTRKHNRYVICEIKCTMTKPVWLENLIKAYGLKVVRNSKYAQAVERIMPSAIHSKSLTPTYSKAFNRRLRYAHGEGK